MVTIKYRDFNDLADLKGMSVAGVREQYTEELGLSDKTRVKLNGERVNRKQEAERILCEDDELCFEEKNRKGLILAGAFLLALALTGGLFAYTQTTQTTTITVTDGGVDYATVAANTTDAADYTVLGKHRGVISEGSLFDVTPDSNYTGDLVLNVFLNNVDEMQNDYSAWIMRLRLANSANTSIDTQGAIEVISLDNPVATFEVQSANITTAGGTVYIHIDGGSYKTYGAGWLSGENPSIYAQIIQAGSH